jgi:hypothetical protein
MQSDAHAEAAAVPARSLRHPRLTTASMFRLSSGALLPLLNGGRFRGQPLRDLASNRPRYILSRQRYETHCFHSRFIDLFEAVKRRFRAILAHESSAYITTAHRHT